MWSFIKERFHLAKKKNSALAEKMVLSVGTLTSLLCGRIGMKTPLLLESPSLRDKRCTVLGKGAL